MYDSEENEQVFHKHVASMWCHFLRQLLPFSRAQWSKVRVVALLQDSQVFFRIHQVKVTMCHAQMQSQSISPGNLCRHQMWRSAIEAGVPKRGHEAHHCFTRVCWHKPAVQVPKLFWHMASQVVLVHSGPLKIPEAFKKLPEKNVGARCWKLTSTSDLSMDASLWAHSHFSNLYLALRRALVLMKAVKRTRSGNSAPQKRTPFPDVSQDALDSAMHSYCRGMGIKEAFNMYQYKSLQAHARLLEVLLGVSSSAKIKHKALKQSFVVLLQTWGVQLLKAHWEMDDSMLAGRAADSVGVLLKHWRSCSSSEVAWNRLIGKLDESEAAALERLRKKTTWNGKQETKKKAARRNPPLLVWRGTGGQRSRFGRPTVALLQGHGGGWLRIQVFFEWGLSSASHHFHSSWPSMTCHTSRLLQCSVSSCRSIPCGSCCTGCSTSTGASKASSSTTCPVILGKALLQLQEVQGPQEAQGFMGSVMGTAAMCVLDKESSKIFVFGCWKHVKIVVFVWKIQWVLSFQTNSSCWFISIKLAFQQWTSKPINLLNLFNRAHSGLSAKRAWLLKTIAFAESAVSKWKFGLFKLSKHLFCQVRS